MRAIGAIAAAPSIPNLMGDSGVGDTGGFSA